MSEEYADMTYSQRMSVAYGQPTAAARIDMLRRMAAIIKGEHDEVISALNRLEGVTGGEDKTAGKPEGRKVETPQSSTERNIETIADLAEAYSQHKDSPIHAVRFQSRVNYEHNIRRLVAKSGTTRLSDLTGPVIDEIYEGWCQSGSKSMAHGQITMLRMMIGFGATVLNDSGCIRLAAILHQMRFEQPKARNEKLTEAQAKAIMNNAIINGWPSIALAQAFQFDCGLRQKDVIGEWVPEKEPGNSGYNYNRDGLKWITGMTWSELDYPMFRHVMSLSQKLVEFDLSNAPLVKEELHQYKMEFPTEGAIILDEDTKLPYRTHTFARRWRICADQAGVPRNVKNMDARAGAIESDEVFVGARAEVTP